MPAPAPGVDSVGCNMGGHCVTEAAAEAAVGGYLGLVAVGGGEAAAVAPVVPAGVGHVRRHARTQPAALST